MVTLQLVATLEIWTALSLDFIYLDVIKMNICLPKLETLNIAFWA